MEEKTGDRRSRRSRRLLKQGLAELMLEKPFNAISVREITDRMDLNRGTFYLHYSDTYQLLQALEDDTLADVQAMIDEHGLEAIGTGTPDFRPLFEPILDYIVENHAVWSALFVHNTSSRFVDKVYRLMYDNAAALLHERFAAAPDEKFKYLVSFLMYGLIGILKQWFDSDRALSKTEVVELAQELVAGSVDWLLHGNAHPDEV